MGTIGMVVLTGLAVLVGAVVIFVAVHGAFVLFGMLLVMARELFTSARNKAANGVGHAEEEREAARLALSLAREEVETKKALLQLERARAEKQARDLVATPKRSRPPKATPAKAADAGDSDQHA